MAQDGVLFAWAGEVHPTFQTPARAIVLQAVWSSVLVWTGTYRALFTRVIYTEWIFFALLGIGILMLRRRPGYHPAWPMPLVPIAPLLFVAASARDRRQPGGRRPARSRHRPGAGASRACRSTGCGHEPRTLEPWNRDDHRLPQPLLPAGIPGRREGRSIEHQAGLRRRREPAPALSRRLQHPRARPSRPGLPRERAGRERRGHAGRHVHHARHSHGGAGAGRGTGAPDQRRVRQRASAAEGLHRFWRRCP